MVWLPRSRGAANGTFGGPAALQVGAGGIVHVTDRFPRLPVGELIEVRRRQRGLSRAVVAELVGRSEEWLRQVERGSRRLDSIEAMVRLAEVLHIGDLRELIIWPGHGALTVRHQEELVVGIRIALAISSWNFTGHPTARYAGRRIDDEVDDAWRVWNGSRRRYSRVAERLPQLVVEVATEGAEHAVPAVRSELYCDVHHLVSSILFRMGEPHLAWLASDRASIRAAGHKATLVAVSRGHVAGCLLALGFQDEALAAVLQVLEWLRPPRRDVRGMTVFGWLCLQALKCAAAQQDLRRVDGIAAMADEAAAAVRTDRTEHHVWFGPTAVAMTSILVALRLGRTNEALRLAAVLEVSDAVPASQRAPYFIKLAEAYTHQKDDVAAVFALVKAVHACREDLRYSGTARDTLSLLLRRNHQLVRDELFRLSRIAGIVE